MKNALVAMLVSATFCMPAAAGDYAPGGNASALARSFALPAIGDSRVLKAGADEARATLDFANEYVSLGYVADGTCPGGECILLDGETARLALDWRHGVGGGWDLGARVPVLDRSGGFLDSWIEQWHGAFGLPNGGRERTPRNQDRYRYEHRGATVLDVTRGGACLGDAEIGAGYALGWDASVRGMAKLPTGDAKKLCGGNAGGAVWLDIALAGQGAWRASFAAGYSVNARNDEVIGAQQVTGVPFGGFALLLPLSARARLHAQIQAHARLYRDSPLAPLARIGAPLTLGLDFRVAPDTWLELGFQEDPSVNASPDFDAYLSLAW